MPFESLTLSPSFFRINSVPKFGTKNQNGFAFVEKVFKILGKMSINLFSFFLATFLFSMVILCQGSNLKCHVEDEEVPSINNGSLREKLFNLRKGLIKAKSYFNFAQRLNEHCEGMQSERMLQDFIGAKTDVNGCSCENGTASCCAQLNVDFRFVHIHQHICANVTYLPESKAVRLVLDVDGVVFNFTLSATNPPPVCLPFIIGELCIRLYNLKVEEHKFYGCSQVELVLFHQEVLRQKLGCFTLPCFHIGNMTSLKH